jgi:hypothetical protein
MIDLVERRGQVGVQRPHPFGPRAFAGVVDRADRVVAATARAEPVRAGFEPGLPLGFQRGTDPALMAPVRDHRDPERPQLRAVTRLGYVHPLDRTGSPRPSLAVHPHRQIRPGRGGQRGLPVDPGRRAASIALRRLPHAEQRVAPAPQQQLLQVPERAQVPVPRRREDPLSQPSYVVLMRAPVDGVPHQGVVRRSVHHEVSNLPSDSDGLASIRFTTHLPTSAPLSGPGHHDPVSGQLPSNGHLEEQPRSLWFPVGFRPPAFASWASCSRQRNSAVLTIGLPGRRSSCRSGSDLVGVPAFRTCETRPGWVPSLLRGGGVVPATATSMTGACRFTTASPLPRYNIPSARVGITKHTKIHQYSPVRSSPRLPSPDGTRMASAFPWASHPTVTHDARQGGDGPS